MLLEPNQEVVMAKPVNENKEMEKLLSKVSPMFGDPGTFVLLLQPPYGYLAVYL